MTMLPDQGFLLIVDADEVNRNVLTRRLERRNHRVMTASSGAAALELIGQHSFDVVLLDINMPGLDGLSVLRQLREKHPTTRLPVIMVTGAEGSDGVVEALNAGANDTIAKPIDFPLTVARIRTQLMLRRTIVALEEANQMLQRISSVDGLTGIANRRRFDEVFEQEWRRAVRTGEWLSLIMIDVDCFKTYNDTYGHAAGDEVLESVAGALAATAHRPADVVARYGGEEFVAVLPKTQVDGATMVAEAMRFNVEALGLPHAKSAAGSHVTVSVGVAATIPAREASQTDLVVKADRALYRAKNEGRNRVQVSEPSAAASS